MSQTRGDLNAACAMALAIVENNRATSDLLKAQKVAEKRTGARGSSARKAPPAAEARAQQAEVILSHPPNSEDAVLRAQEMVSEIQFALEAVYLSFCPHPPYVSHLTYP